ncbi:MAG: DUF4032 domain-containing protein [Streptosporangiales bacterium]|nr:DUF4032 domain-containing protein [Streptosporangiales bacterium]MBO0892187.1 DUF4032 domain-containing protein [Acidothermales bacterium]
MRLHLTAGPSEPALLDLPWSLPLEEWPTDRLVAYPRGISRHTVRFVRNAGTVYAVKETSRRAAEREFRLLRAVGRRDIPAVEAVAVVTDRTTADGSPLDAALVTRHLTFSLPYRALFSQMLRPERAQRFLEALAELLVRLHLAGFYWGDCSLSNTLFRRDAGALAAYLVDAETGELKGDLSPGMRENDLSIATENITGDLLDLEAAGLLDERVDAFATAAEIERLYRDLWCELTREEVVGVNERHRIDSRVRRLNDLGYDVAELEVNTDETGRRLIVRTEVVQPGLHSRRLHDLTGLCTQDRQARRLMSDIRAFQAAKYPKGEAPSQIVVAHRWLVEVFVPIVESVPKHLRGKLEPAEIFHEVLEHRWYLAEDAGEPVDIEAAAADYVAGVLVHKPDEKAVLGAEVVSSEAVGVEPVLATG